MDLTHIAPPHSQADLSHRPASDPRGRDVAAQFEGLLFAQALAPVAKSCGFLGDSIVNVVATDLARHDRGALATTLERAIDSAGASGSAAR